jgi:hypothetical protein
MPVERKDVSQYLDEREEEISTPWGLIQLLGLGVLFYIGCTIFSFFLWLWNGEWHSISCLMILQHLRPKDDWLFHPDSWIGFHKLLDFVNIGWAVSLGIYIGSYVDYWVKVNKNTFKPVEKRNK